MRNWEGFNEIIQINGKDYRITLTEESENFARLFVSPCKLPSAVFEVAEIRTKRNTCMQFDFYEAMIFTDPIVCIIDCSLCQIIKRAIEIYLEESDLFCPGNFNRRCCLFRL